MANTTLHGPSLWFARALWVVFVGAVVVIALGFLPVRFAQFPILCGQDQPALTTPTFVTLCVYYRMTISIALFAATLLVSGIVVWRRSDDWLVLLATAMVISTAALFSFMSALVAVPSEWYYPTLFVRVASPFLIFIFLYIFPDGRVVPRVALVPMLVSLALVLSWFLLPDSPLNIYNLATWPLSLGFFLLWLLLGVALQLYRYFRVSNRIQRQQTKWIVIGTFATFPAFLIVYLSFGVLPDLRTPGLSRFLYTMFAESFFQLAILFTLVCVVIAVLRYRLWDIEVLIRRTVTYAALAAVLALVYLVSVIVLQQLFASATGQRSEVATVLSTLAIAALFVPLRNWLQHVIDRHFNREKYNAQTVLQKFAEKMRDETDLENLGAALLNVVQETMQPKSVSLWLKRERGEVRTSK